MLDAEGDVTIDRLLGGAVSLRQPRRGHRAGTDAVLLAAGAEARSGDHIVDLGSASGAVGLMVAARVPGVRLTFVERDPVLVALCRANILANDLGEGAAALEADAFTIGEDGPLGAGTVDLVVTNPPFFEDGRSSPEPGRRAARTMAGGDLGGWLRSAHCLLRPGGRLAVIHRADKLMLCLDGLRPSFGAIDVTPIHARASAPATRIMVRAIKGRRDPLRLSPAIVLHGEDGRFTPEAARLHGPP